MDVLDLFGFNVVEIIQGFFGNIFAWFFGLLSDLTGIDFDFDCGEEA